MENAPLPSPEDALSIESHVSQESSSTSSSTDSEAGCDPGLFPTDFEVFENFRVIITRKDGELTRVVLPTLEVEVPATLKIMRQALLNTYIAGKAYDLFFPSWTETIHVSLRAEDDQVIHVVETDTELRALLEDERSSPGTIAIRLQACHNVKYSRFSFCTSLKDRVLTEPAARQQGPEGSWSTRAATGRVGGAVAGRSGSGAGTNSEIAGSSRGGVRNGRGRNTTSGKKRHSRRRRHKQDMTCSDGLVTESTTDYDHEYYKSGEGGHSPPNVKEIDVTNVDARR